MLLYYNFVLFLCQIEHTFQKLGLQVDRYTYKTRKDPKIVNFENVKKKNTQRY